MQLQLSDILAEFSEHREFFATIGIHTVEQHVEFSLCRWLPPAKLQQLAAMSAGFTAEP